VLDRLVFGVYLHVVSCVCCLKHLQIMEQLNIKAACKVLLLDKMQHSAEQFIINNDLYCIGGLSINAYFLCSYFALTVLDKSAVLSPFWHFGCLSCLNFEPPVSHFCSLMC